MDYFELIKEYGSGKGEKVMWQATKRISDFIKPMKETNPNEYWGLIKDTYADMCGNHYNEDFAIWEIEQMYFKDKKGEVHHAPHWNKEQYKKTYDANKSRLKNSSYNVWDFAVTLEMIYSDNICMYKEWWENASDAQLEEKVADAVVNYLNDDDDTDGKIWCRFNG